MRKARLLHILAVILTVVGSMLCMAGTQEAAKMPIIIRTSAAEGVSDPAVASRSEEEDLPKLHLSGNISHMYEKSDERIVPFVYEDSERKIVGYVKIKIQGSSSLAYEKKNYTIKLYEDQLCDQKLKIDTGWGAQNEYCLKANWIDKTHARNIVTARIASQVQSRYNVLPDTPNRGLIDGFPIEIYNNGEFLGLYTWNIPKDEWLLNMDGDNPDHIVVCGETWEKPAFFLAEPDFENWSVEVGEDNDVTLQKLDRLFDFVMYSSDEEFKTHIHEYLNLDSVLNYYLIMDLALLHDNLGKNMLLFTYDSRIWYLGLYDLDTSWGTDYSGKNLYDYDLFVCTNRLLQRIEECFGEELCRRYFELRRDIFTKEHILNEFYIFENMIPQKTMEREVLRWGNEIPGYSYDQIEAFLDVRIPILDRKYSEWDKYLRETGLRSLISVYRSLAKDSPKDAAIFIAIVVLIIAIIAAGAIFFVRMSIKTLKKVRKKGNI